MKKIILSVSFLWLALCSLAQENYTGIYGYTAGLRNDQPPKEINAIPGGRLVLIKIKGNMYRFWLDVMSGAPGYNRGETDGTITFKNDTASFDNTFEDAIDPCILKFKKTGATIITIVSQSSSFNCGFGNGVNADGEYKWLQKQEILNNKWLKKQYPQAPVLKIASEKAQVYQDEDGLRSFTQKEFVLGGDLILNITETEKTVYTELIRPDGTLKYGWIRKTDISMNNQ